MHLRVADAALSCRFPRHQLQDADAVPQLNRRTDLSGLHARYHFLQQRIGLWRVQRRFRNVAQVAAVGRGIRIFGIIHGQLRKIRAAVQLVLQHFRFALSLGLVGGVIVLAVAYQRILPRSNHDLGDPVLWFRDVELVAVRTIEIRDVLIRNRHLGRHFAVE